MSEDLPCLFFVNFGYFDVQALNGCCDGLEAESRGNLTDKLVFNCLIEEITHITLFNIISHYISLYLTMSIFISM